MRFRSLVIVWFLGLGMAYGQIRFEASADAESVLLGSTFEITFTLRNAEGNGFRPPDFSPFRVISGPSRSMQTSIINGAMSSSTGFVYLLACPQTGAFTIGPASIQVQGKTLYTKPIRIEVVKASASTKSQEDILIRAVADKEQVYLGEAFTLTYKLYTRVNIQNIETAVHPKLDAFQDLHVNMLNNPVQREIHEGREYSTKILSRRVLYPVKTGKQDIEPALFRVVRGDDDPFGFGFSSIFRSQIENVGTNELRIQVLELPQPIPEGFSGAVGPMWMTIKPPHGEYTLNDAIHLEIQLQGEANFNTIDPDFIRPDSSFEISESRSGDIIKVTDEPKMTKTRKYDYLLVPKRNGSFTIRPQFVYFDPEQKKYIHLKDSFNIRITGGPVAASEAAQADEFLKVASHPKLYFERPRLYKDPLAWLSACLPFGVLFFGWYWRKRSDRVKPPVDVETGASAVSDWEGQFHETERKIVENIRRHWPGQFHGSGLAAARNFLTALSTEDTRRKEYLDMIRQLEQLKYGGAWSADRFGELRRQLDQLGATGSTD
ncbi:MAG TPA: BatD family protein [Saprospiraceae bacterium]|nr:BatD family protein [Saprospiraceae bacterium]